MPDHVADDENGGTALDPRDTREYLIRTLQVHRLRMKNGVGEHLLRNWPTSY